MSIASKFLYGTSLCAILTRKMGKKIKNGRFSKAPVVVGYLTPFVFMNVSRVSAVCAFEHLSLHIPIPAILGKKYKEIVFQENGHQEHSLYGPEP